MRFLTSAVAFVFMTSFAQAHFVFVYITDEGQEACLVFGHAAAPDPKVPATRAEKTSLTARDGNGKETKLRVEKGDGNFYKAALSSEKPIVVFGTTEAGVTQRGDNPPLLSFYYPKVIVGDAFASTTKLGDRAAMEIVPVRDGDAIRFRILRNGKPLASAEVTVGKPGAGEEKDEVVKSDAEGLAGVFSDRGRYCVAARVSEEKAGDFGGKKFTGIRHTATLVCDFRGK